MPSSGGPQSHAANPHLSHLSLPFRTSKANSPPTFSALSTISAPPSYQNPSLLLRLSPPPSTSTEIFSDGLTQHTLPCHLTPVTVGLSPQMQSQPSADIRTSTLRPAQTTFYQLFSDTLDVLFMPFSLSSLLSPGNTPSCRSPGRRRMSWPYTRELRMRLVASQPALVPPLHRTGRSA